MMVYRSLQRMKDLVLLSLGLIFSWCVNAQAAAGASGNPYNAYGYPSYAVPDGTWNPAPVKTPFVFPAPVTTPTPMADTWDALTTPSPVTEDTQNDVGPWNPMSEQAWGPDIYSEDIRKSVSNGSQPDGMGKKQVVLLPGALMPDHYDVELHTHLGNFTFYGKVRIRLRVLEDTDNVTLHVQDMVVDTATIKTVGRGVADPEVTSKSEDAENNFYIIHVKPTLMKGQRLELTMIYKGNLSDTLEGFYRSSYKDDSGNKQWLATTQFEPCSARKAFPCFDEPALKATFSISLIHTYNTSGLSNMPLYWSEDRGDGYIADHFHTTPKMSTYLVAFVVSDFLGQWSRDGRFGVWSRRNAVDQTALALDVGPRVLEFYEGFFTIKYPLPKLDMIAVPDFPVGAMENWGLLTFRETAILFDPRFSSAKDKQHVANVVSHELAHQWFGNLVTMKWWNDLWLNEGFATYVATLGVNAIYPEWRMDEQFVVDDFQEAMELDSLMTSHPISMPVGHPDEINEIFDRISYAKAASIIRMMRYFLGLKSLRYGLTSYLNAKKFDNADQNDLWHHLTAAQDRYQDVNVKKVMDCWTLHTGYPVITVTRNYDQGTVTLVQERFLLRKNSSDSSSSFVWEVPFTLTDALNPDWEPRTRLWLLKKNDTLSGLPNESYWVIGNVRQAGFYRVNYDEFNWKLIIYQLWTDHTRIHVVNRAQIMDDTLDLARAGLLSYDIAMNATLYLHSEREYLPWKAALNSFTHIDVMLSRSPVFGLWKKYIKRQLQPMYEVMGWEETPNENVLHTFVRTITLTWMCKYGHKDCLRTAMSKFEEWRRDPQNTDIMSPDLRGMILCVAVRHGGEDVWDFIWSLYKAETKASEKEKMLESLSCAMEPWLLTRFLNWTLSDNSDIRRQDGSRVFKNVGGKLYGRDLTFDYIRDKWGSIFKRFGSSHSSISSMLKVVTTSLTTPFHLQQLKDFYLTESSKIGSLKRAFEQCIENVEANVKWMEADYPVLRDWLQKIVV